MVPSYGRRLQVSTTDAQLRERIAAHMPPSGGLDVSEIGVVVRGEQVVLWGSVASEQERSLAGAIAAKVTGRTLVINHIEVYRTSVY